MLRSRAIATVSELLYRNRSYALLFIVTAFWLISIVITWFGTSSSLTVDDMEFGFGPYVHALRTTGHYANCDGLPCAYVSRMPLLVWIATGLSFLTTSLRNASVIKDLLMALCSASALALIWWTLPQDRARFWAWFVVGALLCVSIPVVKHAGQLGYEEAYGVPLLLLLGLCATAAFEQGTRPAQGQSMMIGAIVIATLCYLLKESWLLIFLATLIGGVTWAVKHGRRAVIVIAALALLAPIGWGVFARSSSGKFSIVTSFSGENLYRGWSKDSAAIYPAMYLDRIMDAGRVVLPGGETVPISKKPRRRDFADEWKWSAYYKGAAMAWIKEHPGDALRLGLKKAQNYFLSIRKTPFTYSNNAVTDHGSRLQDLVVTMWLVCGRLVVAVFAAGCLLLWFAAPRQRGAVTMAGVLAIAYAGPMVAGFNFERHITAGLVLTLGSALALGGPMVRTLLLDPRGPQGLPR